MRLVERMLIVCKAVIKTHCGYNFVLFAHVIWTQTLSFRIKSREKHTTFNSNKRAQGKLANIISSSFIYSVCFLHAAQLKRSEGDGTFGYILSKTKQRKKIRQTLVIHGADAGA